MKRLASLLISLSCALRPAAASGDGIAFLKGIHVFVADSRGTKVRQIDNDFRKKGLLRWDRTRNRLSYLADPAGKEIARLVIVDLRGKTLREADVPPITDPPESSLRYVLDLWWLPNGKLRVLGGLNPMNCVLFDQDVDAGTADNWHDGVCSGFAQSPDGKHMVARHKNYPAAEEDQIDVMQLDDRERFYVGEDPKGVFWLAGPAWSPDSQNIAIIEKSATTGGVSLVILSVTGAVTRMPVPAGIADRPAVTWVGDKVVVGELNDAMLVDSRTKYVGPATHDLANVLSQSAKNRKDAEARAKRGEELVRELGGREGIVLE